MKFPNTLTRFVDKAPAPETSGQTLTGAFGGVPARISPSNIANVFRSNPTNGALSRGVSSPIAYSPPSAPMLKSAEYHTQIPGVGRLLGMPTVGFRRGTDSIHPAAVTDVQHISSNTGAHPTVARKVLRGNGSV